MATQDEQEAGLGALLSPDIWKRRVVLWGGAVLVALSAIAFTRASDLAFSLFKRALASSPWWALLITPGMFALLAWITSRGLEATRGSGIPQVIAALRTPEAERQRHLSLKVSLAKLGLTVAGLLGGASIGREGPTVHVGAGVMLAVGRRFGLRGDVQARRLLLAGGAAGIAAAFNAPLAGVVFAIEELGGAFEHRFSGTLLTSVIVGGVVSLALLGSYTYFGRVEIALPLRQAWLAVLLCGVVCGLAGGCFSRLLLAAVDGKPRWLGALRRGHPVLFAAGCGLLLAGLGIAFGPGAFGTGYEQARSLVQGHALVGHEFGIVKFVANLSSYLAGIPGGLFSPALAVGAGLGNDLAMLLPILATVLIARGASALVCRTPVYKALAQRLLPKSQESA